MLKFLNLKIIERVAANKLSCIYSCMVTVWHTHTHTASIPPHTRTHIGPVSSRGSHHSMHPCIVPDARKYIWDVKTKLVDEMSCDVIGRAVELDTLEKLEYYPLENVVFFTPIPFLKNHVMSRLFHFLITDIGISFVSSNYLKKVLGKSVLPLNAIKHTSRIVLLFLCQ